MRPETAPDAAWVAALTARPPDAVHGALDAARRDRRLYARLASRHRRAGREAYVEIDAPLELYALVRLLRPDHVVEIGVSSGVSSAYLLQAMHENDRGLLHSIDLPSHPSPRQLAGGRRGASWTLPPGRSTGWAVPGPLWDRWDLRLGDKATLLPILLPQIPRVDLWLYDVPHRCATIQEELRAADRHLGAGSVVLVDHGPGGSVCEAVTTWARSRGSAPVRRTGLGLSGARAARGPPRRAHGSEARTRSRGVTPSVAAGAGR